MATMGHSERRSTETNKSPESSGAARECHVIPRRPIHGVNRTWLASRPAPGHSETQQTDVAAFLRLLRAPHPIPALSLLAA